MVKCSTWGLTLLLFLCLRWTRSQAQQTNYTRPVFLCGGDLVADSGFVGSEGFPSYYKPNSKCLWRITVPEGNVVMLSFRIFDLEADPLCRYDYLDAYNGHSNMVQKLGRFCGTFRPGSLMSTTNTMMLEMASDEATGGRGFLAYFSGGKPTADDQQFCGGKMTKAQGEIQTPNWPQKNYPAGISCSWLITVDPDRVIEVNFDKFDLEADSYCRFDYVAFFNGGEKDDSRLIGKFCGETTPDSMVTNSNVLLVQFVSDLSVTSDGFMASYTSVPRGSQGPTIHSARSVPYVESVPERPAIKPLMPEPLPAIPTQPPTRYVAPPGTEPTEVREIGPVRTRVPGTPGQGGRRVDRRPIPDGRRPGALNPMCAKACKRDGTIKTSYCASEFALTGKVTGMTPGPQGSVQITISLIRVYKSGRLTITQAGEAMSVKLLSTCKKCPLLRRGMNYIIMGQVDEDGRGTLSPGAFTAPYKTPHHRLLINISNQPC